MRPGVTSITLVNTSPPVLGGQVVLHVASPFVNPFVHVKGVVTGATVYDAYERWAGSDVEFMLSSEDIEQLPAGTLVHFTADVEEPDAHGRPVVYASTSFTA